MPFASHAARLAQETDSKSLCDMHIFADVRDVIQSLKQHDCSAALAWCAENRSRLKKIKSSLEFKLRLQEFLELVRKVSMSTRQPSAACMSVARSCAVSRVISLSYS